MVMNSPFSTPKETPRRADTSIFPTRYVLRKLIASMNAAMPALILHEGKSNQPPSAQRTPTRQTETEKRETPACSAHSAVNVLSRALAVRELCRSLLHSLRSTLAHQQQADSLQQIRGRIHSSGQEDVGLRFMIVSADFARNQNGWSMR